MSLAMRAGTLALLALPCVADQNLFVDQWREVANRAIGVPAANYGWDYGAGLLMTSLLRVTEQTSDTRFLEYADKWAATVPPLTPDNNAGQAAPGFALASLYEATQKPLYLRTAAKIIEDLDTRQRKSPEGAIAYRNTEIRVDTMYFAAPLLAHAGKVQRKPKLTDLAANQLILHAQHLQNPRSGLVGHAWNWHTNNLVNAPWARGNGWFLMSITDTIDAMQKADAMYSPVRGLLQRALPAILESQLSNGLWPTLLDEANSESEVSASSMICYSLLKLVRMGIIDEQYRDPAIRAWKAINQSHVREGRVTGVAEAAEPGTREHYRGLSRDSYPWGTGAYLLAGSEIARLPLRERRKLSASEP
jgi:unsaturated rhamnogalacturonyl hydrolase